MILYFYSYIFFYLYFLFKIKITSNIKRLLNINNQNINITHMYESLAKQSVHSRRQIARIIKRLSNIRSILLKIKIHVTPQFNRKKATVNPNTSFHFVF